LTLRAVQAAADAFFHANSGCFRLKRKHGKRRLCCTTLTAVTGAASACRGALLVRLVWVKYRFQMPLKIVPFLHNFTALNNHGSFRFVEAKDPVKSSLRKIRMERATI
jgi:hypothetical protein